MMRLVQRLSAMLDSPAVVGIAAAVASLAVVVLQGAVEGAKQQLQALEDEYAARSGQLDEVLSLLRRSAEAQQDGASGQAGAEVLALAAERGYPAAGDVDPLQRGQESPAAS